MKEMIFKGGLTKYWWVPMLTGIFAIVIGIWCLCSPASSIPTLAYVFSILLIIAGVANSCLAITARRTLPTWGWALAMGIIELVCGIWLLTLPMPALTMTFVYAIGIYMLFVVINSICEACVMATYESGFIGWLIAFLLVTLVLTIVFLAGPIAGGVAVWLYIGLSFIFFGIYRLMLACKIRRINRQISF
ncbi:MAG: DUF308 domain-containing protein [Candidatus Amulumruptor caecigallinarius]|nr:DUF308 domain-containing protein [Candidatus Amulumruptor caecigallinarius]MCM1397486.1 DUF308 domain-containing protein [Candidatus Amulumruptor caecigallinarius]MCM1454388.1 DUF308 domain-containing protein [bacterium]